MFILKLLVLWIVIGLANVIVASIIHLIVSYKKGYDVLGWWNKHSSKIFSNAKHLKLQFVIGLIIWPIRLVEFVRSIPGLYEQYNLRK